MSAPTVYLNFTADQMWVFDRQGLCINCGLSHKGGDCFARECTSCTQFWLSDTQSGDGEGRPAKEYCPDCLKCEFCGDELDEDRAGEPCYDCKKANEREQAEKEYWEEYNRTRYITSSYNDGGRT